MKIDENILDRKSLLLNDLRNFNKISGEKFRRDATYDNVKIHRKAGFYPIFSRYIFREVFKGWGSF